METKNMVAAIIMREDHCLAVKRKGSEYDGYYEFPGCASNQEENPETALMNHIASNLGCTIEVRHKFRDIDYDYPDYHLSKQLFICDITSGEIILKENDDYEWITIYDLENIEWLPAEESILFFLRNFLTAEMI